MNTPSQQRHTNEASPELLRTLDQSPFTELQLASFGEEALAIIEQQQAYVRAPLLLQFTGWQPKAAKPVTAG